MQSINPQRPVLLDELKTVFQELYKAFPLEDAELGHTFSYIPETGEVVLTLAFQVTKEELADDDPTVSPESELDNPLEEGELYEVTEDYALDEGDMTDVSLFISQLKELVDD